jgi:hypothetical protein
MLKVMLFSVLFVSLIAMAAKPAAGLTLQPIMQPNDPKLPIATNQPPIPCDQIATAMDNFKQMEEQHENSLTSFLSDVGTKVSTWYTQLSPFEGTNQPIPAGTFSVLQDGGNKISTITDMAFDNSDLLAQELDHIITSLHGCTITAPTLK